MVMPIREKDGRFYLPGYVTWPLILFCITCIFVSGGVYYELKSISSQFTHQLEVIEKLIEKQTEHSVQIEVLKQQVAASPPIWLLDRISRIESRLESVVPNK